MDFSILYAIQRLRCPFMDRFILLLTKAAGDYGQIWLLLAAALMIFKRTRRTAFVLLLSYVFVLVSGQLILKDLIARPRPCHLDETIELLVERPDSWSCPSTHSAWAFAAAASVFISRKKAGLWLGPAALLIAFSRLYLFVHFPSDVLLGAALGAACALAAAKIVDMLARVIDKKRTAGRA